MPSVLRVRTKVTVIYRNVDADGRVDTLTRAMSQMLDSDETREQAIDLHPFRGLGIPDDIARVAVFLASEDASWVTGVCFNDILDPPLILIQIPGGHACRRRIYCALIPLGLSRKTSLSCKHTPLNLKIILLWERHPARNDRLGWHIFSLLDEMLQRGSNAWRSSVCPVAGSPDHSGPLFDSGRGFTFPYYAEMTAPPLLPEPLLLLSDQLQP